MFIVCNGFNIYRILRARVQTGLELPMEVFVLFNCHVQPLCIISWVLPEHVWHTLNNLHYWCAIYSGRHSLNRGWKFPSFLSSSFSIHFAFCLSTRWQRITIHRILIWAFTWAACAENCYKPIGYSPASLLDINDKVWSMWQVTPTSRHTGRTAPSSLTLVHRHVYTIIRIYLRWPIASYFSLRVATWPTNDPKNKDRSLWFSKKSQKVFSEIVSGTMWGNERAKIQFLLKPEVADEEKYCRGKGDGSWERSKTNHRPPPKTYVILLQLNWIIKLTDCQTWKNRCLLNNDDTTSPEI